MRYEHLASLDGSCGIQVENGLYVPRAVQDTNHFDPVLDWRGRKAGSRVAYPIGLFLDYNFAQLN